MNYLVKGCPLIKYIIMGAQLEYLYNDKTSMSWGIILPNFDPNLL